MKAARSLIAWLLACFAVTAIGGWFTSLGLREWYPTLRKPGWTPPNWVFGPVWTALYAMMAVAAWLLWRRRDRPGAGLALKLFAIQLALNLAWTGLFFGLHRTGWAFVDISALFVAILALIATAEPIDRRAALLLLPYLVWVGFASALNLAIWAMNSPLGVLR